MYLRTIRGTVYIATPYVRSSKNNRKEKHIVKGMRE